MHISIYISTNHSKNHEREAWETTEIMHDSLTQCKLHEGDNCIAHTVSDAIKRAIYIHHWRRRAVGMRIAWETIFAPMS